MVELPTDIEVASVISEMESQEESENEFLNLTDISDTRNETSDFSELDRLLIFHLSKMKDYKAFVKSESFEDLLDLYRFSFLVGLKSGRSQAALDNLISKV